MSEAGLRAAARSDGGHSLHCARCGKFLSAGEPRRIPEGLLGPDPVFPEGAGPGFAGRPIQSVSDAVCSEHGVVERGAFWSPQEAEI